MFVSTLAAESRICERRGAYLQAEAIAELRYNAV